MFITNNDTVSFFIMIKTCTIKFITLTIFMCSFFFFFSFWLHLVFVAAFVLSLVAENGGYSLVVVHGLFIVVVFLVA